jgi:hypothetical protein
VRARKKRKEKRTRVKLIIIFDGIDEDFYVKGHVYCAVDQKEEIYIYIYIYHIMLL